MEIESLVKKMMIEDPFYGFMLTTLERRYSDDVPTLQVQFNSRMNAEILINKKFFEQYSDDTQMQLLKHELLHVAFKHVVLCDSFPNKRLFNIAADLEVNSYLKNLPDGALLAEDFGFQPKQGTMYYYRELMKQLSVKKSQQDDGAAQQTSWKKDDDSDAAGTSDAALGSGDDEAKGSPNEQPRKTEDVDKKQTLDDHSVWEKKENRQAQHVVGAAIDDILIRAANGVKSRGHVPGEMAGIIKELEKPLKPIFDWKKAFRRFMGNAYTENKKRSRRKESRRFAGSSGSQHTKRASVLVAIDTSASVSDKELHEFVSELTHMSKTGTHIHVLECDARIQREYDFKPGCIKGVSGRGGTRFEPVINYYRDHYRQYETLIFFTDGEASIDFSVPQDNMLWVITSSGLRQTYPGKTLYIPVQNQ